MPKLLSPRTLIAAAFLILALTAVAAATNGPEYTQIGRDINIGPDQQVGEVTCIACNIHIRDQISGDATTVGGSIVIEDRAQVSGDVTAVAGNIRIDKEVKVSGDVTVVGGEIRRSPEAQIAGDVTSVGGRAWMPVILIAPFLFLGLLVALVVRIIHHFRRSAATATA